MQDTTKISKQICTWKQIWENKSSQLDTHLAPEEILKQLFVLAGFDSSGLNVQNYRDFIRRVFEWAKLEDCESLYEVGCGAGAFLYAMSLEKNTKNGGGDITHWWNRLCKKSLRYCAKPFAKCRYY